MKSVVKYPKIDYHYLVVEDNWKFMCVNLMGELSFPCIQLSASIDINNALYVFNNEGYLSTWITPRMEHKSVVYKDRYCGVRRIYHYLHNQDIAFVPGTFVEVPVVQAVRNKPAVLSTEAKAILRKLPRWKLWKEDFVKNCKIHNSKIQRSTDNKYISLKDYVCWDCVKAKKFGTAYCSCCSRNQSRIKEWRDEYGLPLSNSQEQSR